MKFLATLITAILVAGLGSCERAHAQVSFNPQNYTVTPVNGGTGTIVSIPVGTSGLNVSVGTGSAAIPLENIAGTQGATQLRLGDDSGANVPLGFSFPYWGQSFNNSWMYSNGIVSFANGNLPGAGCCSGQNLQNLAASRNTTYNYMIAPLWTDLIDVNGNATWYKGNSTSMTYGWYNTHEYYNNNTSSFEVNINASGALSVRYANAFVSTGHAVTAGMTGNLANGEYFQYYYGNGFNIPASNPVTWGTTGAFNACAANPLSSTSCPGYQTAYTTQQCTISALYDPSCPGYQAAYLTQQCTANPLYNSTCPGYQQAYHDQQCSINPLYATDCNGYAQAYHDQQCSVNQLYATDCPGYAAAYLDQQCSINPLYSTTCRGYASGYLAQQCSINSLYSTQCPGYAQAYFNQQCSLNGLYDRTCPNYSTAYATRMLLEQQSMASTVATAGVVAQTAPTTSTTTTTVGSVSTTGTVSATGNTTVDRAVSAPAPTAAPAAAPAAPVQLVQSAPAAAPTPAAPQQQSQQQERKPEGGEKKQDAGDKPAGGPSQVAAGPQPDAGPKDQPKTARQEIQERRQAAADKEAAGKGKEAAAEMKTATSFESQKQVQGVVIQAMAFTPGFDVYKTLIIPDGVSYKPFSIYGNQKTVDNRNLGRGLFGPTDRLHNEMVDSQYNRGN